MGKMVESGQNGGSPHSGSLIMNADDWGRDLQTTDRSLECFRCGAISSVSAMVFMQDSERAAAIARESGIDVGLHLNFTTPFTTRECSSALKEHHRRLSAYLRSSRFAQVFYHPGLARSFQYAAAAQRDEFCRLYGAEPDRYDGHHHMHLCANVLLGGLLSPGTVVRRNFSFQPGEKSFWNRAYRQTVDRMLARRYVLTDCFFLLPPLDPRERIKRIFSLAKDSIVEVETHPVNREEHRFLAGGEIFRWTGGVPVVQGFGLPASHSSN
jgi:predicted glycoside hydrolase/deacetylase ChbG (UPF0249 family)